MAEVLYQRRGPAAWLTLNRPERRNALTPALVADLHRALDAAAGPRVLAVTGAGPAFCAGADLGYFLARVRAPGGCAEFTGELLEPLARALGRLREPGRLVIAAVNGACFAGGLELLVACDLVIAAPDATFCDAHSQRGLAPAVGGVPGLVRAVGPDRALRIMALSEVLSAAQAAAAGLVSEVTAAGDLQVRAQEVAELAATRSPGSLAARKRG